MINIVKKYLWKEIHELNILIGCSDDSLSQAQNKYTVKNRLLRNNYRWLLPLFRQILRTKLPYFSEINLVPPLFFT